MAEWFDEYPDDREDIYDRMYKEALGESED